LNNTELKAILKAFILLVAVCLCVMFTLMGLLKAQCNSEYYLNGTGQDYITFPSFVPNENS